jgi:hypothetical protein
MTTDLIRLTTWVRPWVADSFPAPAREDGTIGCP